MSDVTAKAPTVVDLFCGAGGFSLGFHSAGCRILAGVDRDEVAGRTYSRNLDILQKGDSPVVARGERADLNQLSPDDLGLASPPDILIGSPPCQAFSRIGRAKLSSLSERSFVDDPRNGLYKMFLEWVRHWSPRAVVMENVPGMLTVSGKNMASVVAWALAECGYNVGHAVLNAAWYGVPQFRERVIFIGIRQDLEHLPSMPDASHHVTLPGGYIPAKKRLQLYLGAPPVVVEPPVELASPEKQPGAVTVRDAIGDLPAITRHLEDGDKGPPRGDFRREIQYGMPAKTGFASEMREWPGFEESTSIVDHEIRRTPRDYRIFALMKPGDRYPRAHQIARGLFCDALLDLQNQGNLPEPESTEYKKLLKRFVPPYDPAKFKDKWRMLDPKQPSRTLPAHLSRDSYSHIHYDPDQARMISIREAARLQSFPDAFHFEGNMGDCFRQIGNAVPPVLAKAIASCLIRQLGEVTKDFVTT